MTECEIGADEDMLTTTEVAKRLKVNRRTVNRWVQHGGLPCYRAPVSKRGKGAVYRFVWSEVLDWWVKEKGVKT